jgi:uncharacterized protein YfcZ (UPF0381/DUF406 family)
MTTNNILNNQTIDDQLTQLTKELKQTELEIMASNDSLNQDLTKLTTEARQTISEVEQIHQSLDQAEQSAEADLDSLMLQELEDLAKPVN